HLEEVERIVHELLCGSPRNKRAIVERTSTEPAKPRSDRGTRIFIFQVQLHQRRKTEAHAIRVGLGKPRPQHAVEQEARLKVRSSGRVLDLAHPIAQVQLFGALFDWPEQALQTAP